MAKVEVLCPHCKRIQSVPTRRLHTAWVCLVCRGTIDDPYMNKRRSEVPKLAIPLHGKISSVSGITNLSEIVADSEEYSKGFKDSPWDPSKLAVVDRTDEWEAHQRGAKRQALILLVCVLLLIGGGGAALWWFVIRQAL
jgi:hypothetical protein